MIVGNSAKEDVVALHYRQGERGGSGGLSFVAHLVVRGASAGEHNYAARGANRHVLQGTGDVKLQSSLTIN